MKKTAQSSGLKVLLRGGGDIASGIAWRLHKGGFRVFITEIHQPLAVRRTVAFCEAVYDQRATVEGVEAALIENQADVSRAWFKKKIPIAVDPLCERFIRRRAIRHMEKGSVVIFAGGTGNPFVTTDTGAALRCAEVRADVLL